MLTELTDTNGKLSELPVLSKELSQFVGWFTDLNNGEQVSTDTVFDKDTTLYAHWNKSDGNVDDEEHFVSVSSETNGKISVMPATALKGTIISVIVEPNPGYTMEGLFVIEKGGLSIPVEKKGECIYQFTMPDTDVEVSATFIAVSSGGAQRPTIPVTPPTPQPPESSDPSEPDKPITPEHHSFSDVPTNTWYSDAVQYVFERGLMVGVSETAFNPNASTTRGQLVTILYRMEGSPSINSINRFSDVLENQWYSDAIKWATVNGIIGGYGNGKFGPEDSITREQLIVVLYRYLNLKNIDTSRSTDMSVFSDYQQISEYAYSAMQWAVAEGLVCGTSASTVTPVGNSTRAQLAVILQRLCEKFYLYKF